MSMCVDGTPVIQYPELGLWVKHEEQCCPSGPNFSKTRGVYAHIKDRPESIIGVLDTHHSNGGWAVARACQLLGKQCYNYYPVRKSQRRTDRHGREVWDVSPQQTASLHLGAVLHALPAGRSAVLYHQAKKHLHTLSGPVYFMPNALKLPEMITETVAEVYRTQLPDVDTVIVSASSGTIAAGVWKGLFGGGFDGQLVVHQGYSRTETAVRSYMTKMAWGERPPPHGSAELVFVDEGYSYGDMAKPGSLPPFQCNQFYDLKAFRWWMREGRARYDEALLWNIG